MNVSMNLELKYMCCVVLSFLGCGDAGFFQSWAMFELRNSYEKDQVPGDVPATVDDVRRLFKRAVDCNKFHSASWVAWAKFEQKSGNPEIARKLLIAGISKFPNSKNIGWFHSTLGETFFFKCPHTQIFPTYYLVL